MTLISEHQTHIHYLFYSLCSERKWCLGLPTMFDYEYLEGSETKVQAKITLSDVKPTIYFHPNAFDKCKGYLLKGLLHHELCHYILGIEKGHNSEFHHFEHEWEGYLPFKQESSQFSRWLLTQKPIFRLTCLNCGESYLRNRVPAGKLACRKCCEDYSNGEYDDNYTLHIGGAILSTS